jgi:hypothetical protein
MEHVSEKPGPAPGLRDLEIESVPVMVEAGLFEVLDPEGRQSLKFAESQLSDSPIDSPTWGRNVMDANGAVETADNTFRPYDTGII